MLIGNLNSYVARVHQQSIARQIATVSPSEARDGARATGYAIRVAREELAPETLQLFEQIARSRGVYVSPSAVKAGRRKVKQQQAKEPPATSSAPPGWLLADSTQLGEPSLGDFSSGSDRVDIATAKVAAQPPSPPSDELGWLLAPCA